VRGGHLSVPIRHVRGNHLLKTVALNDALEEYEIDGVISGIGGTNRTLALTRRSSPASRPDIYPPHDRIQPILQFDEADVWDVFWSYVVPDTVADFPDDGYVPESVDDIPDGVSQESIPISPKYFAGFRSLGSEVSTEKTKKYPPGNRISRTRQSVPAAPKIKRT